MTKKIISIFILFTFLLGTAPVSVFADTSTTAKKTTVAKKKVTKKKAKKKEKLTLEPPLFTLDTAPHSPKPLARGKKKTKKVAIKKPGSPSKVVATKKK